MGLKRSILLINAAVFATGIFGVNAAVPDTLLSVDNSGCVAYTDHNALDLDLWACAFPFRGPIEVVSGRYKITVFSGFQGGDNPPTMSKPEYTQTFEWENYRGDVSVSENGCLQTVAKSGQPAQQIGPCAPSEYTGPVMSNPYRQKIDFHKGFLRRISDSGVDPFEVASTEISSTEINSAETAQSAPGNPSFLAANEAFNQPLLPLAEFTVPGSSSSDGPDGPEYVNFNTVKRSRKRRRDI